MISKLISSRSAYATYLVSQRQYYIDYQFAGRGITPKSINPNLQIGIYCHAVCGGVMSGKSEDSQQAEQTEIWNELASTRGFDSLHPPELLLALAQGLSSAWIRTRFKEIEKSYEILAVEKPRLLSIQDSEFELLVPTRLDAELRSLNSDKNYHALEIKTTSSKRYFDKYKYDIQPLQHLWAIEDAYGQGSCHSILMEFLYKGYGNMQTGGTWYSPFVRGYVKIGVEPYDSTQYSTNGKKYGNRKDWNDFDVWQRFTQDEWYAKAGKVLDAQILNMSVVRDRRDLPVYQHQMFHAHKRIAEGLQKLEDATSENEKAEIMGIYFPLAYHMFDHHLINFSPEQALDSGDYIFREPHHELEKEFLAKKSFNTL